MYHCVVINVVGYFFLDNVNNEIKHRNGLMMMMNQVLLIGTAPVGFAT